MGHTDDLVVVILALGSFLLMNPRDVLNEYLTGRPADLSADAGSRDSRGNVVEGQYRHVEDEDEDKRKS